MQVSILKRKNVRYGTKHLLFNMISSIPMETRKDRCRHNFKKKRFNFPLTLVTSLAFVLTMYNTFQL